MACNEKGILNSEMFVCTPHQARQALAGREVVLLFSLDFSRIFFCLLNICMKNP